MSCALLQTHCVERTSTETILMMSLLPFWAMNVEVVSLSMESQKALEFHQKYRLFV